MINTSMFGAVVNIVASQTFPNGFTVTEFPDDQNPFDSQPVRIAESGMGTGGHHVVWQKPNLIPFSLSVIPNTESHRNLDVLAEANRMSKHKGRVPLDEITIKILYPNGKVTTLTGGMIAEAPQVLGASSAGKLNTQTYQFAFEDRYSTDPA